MLPNDDRYKNLFGTGDATPDFTPDDEEQKPGKPFCCVTHTMLWLADKLEKKEVISDEERAKAVANMRAAAAQAFAEEAGVSEVQVVAVPDGVDMKEILKTVLGVKGIDGDPKPMTLRDDGRAGVYLKQDGTLIRTEQTPGNFTEVSLNTKATLIVAGKITAWALKMGALMGKPKVMIDQIQEISQKELARVEGMTKEEFYGME